MTRALETTRWKVLVLGALVVFGLGMIAGAWMFRFTNASVPKPVDTTQNIIRKLAETQKQEATASTTIKTPLTLQGGNLMSGDHVLVTDIPDYVRDPLLGPDGRTIHFRNANSGAHDKNIASAGCLIDLSKITNFPVSLKSVSLDCEAGMWLGEGVTAYLSVPRNAQPSIVWIENGKQKEYPVLGGVDYSDTSVLYQYPRGSLTTMTSKGKRVFLLFGDDVFLLDPDNVKSAQWVTTIPKSGAWRWVRLVYVHPSLPLAVLATGWESPEQAHAIIDFSQNPVRTIESPVPFGVETTSIWHGGWAWSDSAWTADGVEFYEYEHVSLPLPKQADAVCQAYFDGGANESQKVNAYARQLEQEFSSQLDVGQVRCDLCAEGPGSGWGCAGMTKKTTYRFRLGEKVIEKVNMEQWSGRKR